MPDVGGRAVTPTAVSADGSIVVGWLGEGSASEAFRWTEAEGVVPLGSVSPGELSQAFGISADGHWIVGRCGQQLCRWSSAGLEAIASPAGGFQVQGNDASADGSIIVGVIGLGGSGAFPMQWTGGGEASVIHMTNGGVSAVSDDGNVLVGDTYTVSTMHACRWTSAGPELLDNGGAANTSAWAHGISGDGNVIVGFASPTNGALQAGWWDVTGKFTALDSAASTDTDTQALAASGDGSVIVGISCASGSCDTTAKAFVWDATGGMRPLDSVLTGYPGSFTTAVDVSADGSVIVGQYRDEASQVIGYRVVVPK